MEGMETRGIDLGGWILIYGLVVDILGIMLSEQSPTKRSSGIFYISAPHQADNVYVEKELSVVVVTAHKCLG